VLHSVSLFCNMYIVDLFALPSCQDLFKNSKEHHVSFPSTSHVKNVHETSNKGADSDGSSSSSPEKRSASPANSNPTSKIKVCMMYCLYLYTCAMFLFSWRIQTRLSQTFCNEWSSCLAIGCWAVSFSLEKT